jgi:hypothetical protein
MRELFLRVRLGLVAHGIDRPRALMASPFLIRKARCIVCFGLDDVIGMNSPARSACIWTVEGGQEAVHSRRVR